MPRPPAFVIDAANLVGDHVRGRAAGELPAPLSLSAESSPSFGLPPRADESDSDFRQLLDEHLLEAEGGLVGLDALSPSFWTAAGTAVVGMPVAEEPTSLITASHGWRCPSSRPADGSPWQRARRRRWASIMSTIESPRSTFEASVAPPRDRWCRWPRAARRWRRSRRRGCRRSRSAPAGSGPRRR